MRLIFLNLVMACCCAFAKGQSVVGNAAIGNTGCTVQVFCFPGRFDTYDLEDGSTVYADDCEKDGIVYGIYCVRLKKELSINGAAEDTAVVYLDFLKLDFGIVSAKGYEKGYRLRKNERTRGIADSWEDADKHKWKIRAWTDGRFICILYVHSDKEMAEKKTQPFLEGLQFPPAKK